LAVTITGFLFSEPTPFIQNYLSKKVEVPCESRLRRKFSATIEPLPNSEFGEPPGFADFYAAFTFS
jgi:hypothetical protein